MADKVTDGALIDYWKYVKPDPKGLDSNPYINPPKAPAPNIGPGFEPAPDVSLAGGASIANVSSGFITLENIVCVDANGKVIEKYDSIDVRKDIERDSKNDDVKKNQINFTPYDAAVYFEGQGLFLPSFALSCNILAALYNNKSDAEIAKVLLQYKNKGNGYGWHAQNTLVNWGAKQIIHYPNGSDYTSVGGKTAINSKKTRMPYDFNDVGFSSIELDKALKITNYRQFIKNLTGLQQPEKLIELGNYFGKPAKSWISTSNDTRAAWLGCGSGSFSLDAGGGLGIDIAARGVRISPR